MSRFHEFRSRSPLVNHWAPTLMPEMSFNDRELSALPESQDPDAAAGLLSGVEAEITRRCADMIDQAHQQAARIIQAAEEEASARRRRDADLIAELGRQVAEMSTAYREAMTAARRTVEFLAAKVRMGTEQHQL